MRINHQEILSYRSQKSNSDSIHKANIELIFRHGERFRIVYYHYTLGVTYYDTFKLVTFQSSVVAEV